jgi:hypothetical protein
LEQDFNYVIYLQPVKGHAKQMQASVAFDRAMITAQLELKEDASWGKHH